MRLLIFAMTAAIAMTSTAVELPKNESAAAKPGTVRQKVRMNKAEWERRTGGKIVKPNSVKGKIVFLDVGNALADGEYAEVIAKLRKDMRFDFQVVRKEGLKEGLSADVYAAMRLQLGAEVLVVVHRNERGATMTAAPEDGWAAMNVTKLERGLTNDAAKTKFLASRYRKELMRTLAYACGAGGTGYPGNILAIAKVEDLDYCGEFLPHDSIQQIVKLLKVRGMSPELQVPYIIACREGWAPAPTNDVQKAIWDKVHQLPTKPIKILPEKKPVKD